MAFRSVVAVLSPVAPAEGWFLTDMIPVAFVWAPALEPNSVRSVISPASVQSRTIPLVADLPECHVTRTPGLLVVMVGAIVLMVAPLGLAYPTPTESMKFVWWALLTLTTLNDKRPDVLVTVTSPSPA